MIRKGLREVYHIPYTHQCPYCGDFSNYTHLPMNIYGNPTNYGAVPNGWNFDSYPSFYSEGNELKDFGANPLVIDIHEASKQNNAFRTALWTGNHLQVTLMSLNVGEDVGLEIHPHVDQFLRVEQGQGIVQMGKSKDNLNFECRAYDGSAILIPAGTWHNLTNTGNIPLKLYSIYAPPNHPFGTVHKTKADAMRME